MKLPVLYTVSLTITIALTAANNNENNVKKIQRTQGENADSSYLPRFLSGLFGGEEQEKELLPRKITRSTASKLKKTVKRRKPFNRRPVKDARVPVEYTGVRLADVPQVVPLSSRFTRPVIGEMGASSQDPWRRSIISTSKGLASQQLKVTGRPDTLSGGPAQTSQVSTTVNAMPTPPHSLEGWLAHPTQAPSKRAKTTTSAMRSATKEKEGHCGNAVSYGIQCKQRMDQCTEDMHCPGATRCCMVGDCGTLCVKPKGKGEEAKRRRMGATSVMRRQQEAEKDTVEISTTSFGLKIDDIAAKRF